MTLKNLIQEQNKDFKTRQVRHYIINPTREVRPFNDYSDLQERTILILYFMGGLTLYEIGSIVGISKQAVQKVISTATQTNTILKNFKKLTKIIKKRRFYERPGLNRRVDGDGDYNTL